MPVTVFLLVALGAFGCAGSLPTTHYYTLVPPAEVDAMSFGSSDTDPDGDDVGLVVGVESFAVDPPYDQDRLVFRRGADSAEVGFYAYHRWASPLGRMIALAVAERLRGAPGVRSIEPAGSVGDYSARLGGRVLYVEEVDLSNGEQVRVGIAFELRDPDGEILWTETAAAVASGNAEDGGAVAQLIRSTVEEVLLQARTSLATALSE
ncbi:MAG: PqiC family protein [Acidobacteriota bacterium]|nr:PqiC family protein [Acidobacteriota bacterium]